MEDKPGKKADFRYSYKYIGPHKMSRPVEVFFAMGEKNVGIYIAMNQKEHDQKNACEGHGNFLTD